MSIKKRSGDSYEAMNQEVKLMNKILTFKRGKVGLLIFLIKWQEKSSIGFRAQVHSHPISQFKLFDNSHYMVVSLDYWLLRETIYVVQKDTTLTQKEIFKKWLKTV